MLQERNRLLQGCQRSARYHHAREQFLHTAHLRIQFAVFAASMFSATCVYKGWTSEKVDFILWLFIGFLALLSLVWNPANTANQHKFLRRDFTKLIGKISSDTDPVKKTLATWTDDIYALYAQEPPVYRALHAHCHNQLAIARDASDGNFIKMMPWHRWLRNVCPFQGQKFLTNKQKAERKKSA